MNIWVTFWATFDHMNAAEVLIAVLGVALLGSLAVGIPVRLITAILGKPKWIRDELASPNAVNRVGFTAVLGLCPLLLFGAIAGITAHITASMPSASIEVAYDTTDAGNFIKMFRSELPKEYRRGIGKDDLVLVQGTPKSHALYPNQKFLKVLKVENERLREKLISAPGKNVWIHATQHTQRYPAKIVDWYGPFSETAVVMSYDSKKVIADVTGWTTILVK